MKDKHIKQSPMLSLPSLGGGSNSPLVRKPAGQQGSGDPWLDFSTQNVSTTRSFTFKADGTKVYTCESNNSNDNYVLEFNLSTAWDLSTASYVQKDSTTFGGFGDGYIRGLTFSSDGTKLITSHSSNTYLYMYNLSTAWDISTLSAYSGNKSYYQSTGSFDGYGGNIQWKSDGSKYYVLGAKDETIYEFDASGGNWRVQGSLYDPYPANSSGYTDYCHAMGLGMPQSMYSSEFNSNGTKIFIMRGGSIYRRNLGTAYNIKTITSSGGQYKSLSGLGYGPHAFKFNSAGTKLLILEISNKRVEQWSLSSAFDITTLTDDNVDLALNTGGGPSSVYTGTISDDGKYIYVYTNGTMYQWTLSTPFDLTTGSFTRSQSGFSGGHGGVKISPNGTQMLTLASGQTGATFRSYTLGTAWDISSYSFDKSFDLQDMGSLPPLIHASGWSVVDNGGANNENGWYFFPYYAAYGFKISFTGNNGWPFDLNNKSFNGKAPVYCFHSTKDQDRSGYFIKPDGTAIYTMQRDNIVRRHNMSTAWDISTASYHSASSALVNQDTGASMIARGLFFQSDGSKLFYGDATHIFYYNLTTPWDLSTLSAP